MQGTARPAAELIDGLHDRHRLLDEATLDLRAVALVNQVCQVFAVLVELPLAEQSLDGHGDAARRMPASDRAVRDLARPGFDSAQIAADP